MTAQPTVHRTEFFKNRHSGVWKAVCTCGWFHIGGSVDVQNRAAVHDLGEEEWIAADPKAPKPDIMAAS